MPHTAPPHRPGSRAHDPPIARDGVRLLAFLSALFGALWLARAVAGTGGALVVCAALLALSLASLARARRS